MAEIIQAAVDGLVAADGLGLDGGTAGRGTVVPGGTMGVEGSSWAEATLTRPEAAKNLLAGARLCCASGLQPRPDLLPLPWAISWSAAAREAACICSK